MKKLTAFALIAAAVGTVAAVAILKRRQDEACCRYDADVDDDADEFSCDDCGSCGVCDGEESAEEAVEAVKDAAEDVADAVEDAVEDVKDAFAEELEKVEK